MDRKRHSQVFLAEDVKAIFTALYMTNRSKTGFRRVAHQTGTCEDAYDAGFTAAIVAAAAAMNIRLEEVENDLRFGGEDANFRY